MIREGAGRDRPLGPRGDAPAAKAAMAFVAGIWLGAWSEAGATSAALAAGCCAALLALAVGKGAPKRAASRAAFAVLWTALGFWAGATRLAEPARTARETWRLLPAGRDRADRIEGVLTDFWTGLPPRVHGRMRAERLEVGGAWRPFPADVFLFVSGEAPPENVAGRGDRVIAVGHLAAEGPSPSMRDLELPWPGYRLSIKSALRIESARPTPLSVLMLPNRWLSGRLPAPGTRGAGFDRDVRGPLVALLLGRTSELDRGMVARYRRGGLYHLLVVSGLHVALAAGLVLWTLRCLGVFGKKRDALVLSAVLLFVLVAGANPPAVRAGIVGAVLLAARLLERPIPPLQTIGLSALVLFAAAPAQIFSIGTVLTFAAVLGIALFTVPIRARLPARPAFLFTGLAAALAAQAGTAPILLWRFNVVSAGAWLTAPLSIPLSSAMIAAGGLLLAFFAAGVYPAPLVFLFAAGSRILEFLAERASGIAYLRPTPPLVAVLAVSLLTLLGATAARRLRVPSLAAAALLFLFLAFRRGPAGPSRGFSLEALDVGQGDAILLRWDRRAILVDGGGPFDLDARDFGRTRLLPKLLDRGVTRLDAAILTHPHPDHALGLFAVLEELPVAAFWRGAGEDENNLYRDLERIALERGARPAALLPGRAAVWPRARLTILSSGGPRRKTDATNNQSLVALFERDGRRALLTGDAGAAAESELLRLARVPAADILKVGHHGSRGSTTPEFLAAASPREAVISCGRENRFGHPAPETLRALGEARVPVFRTDLRSDTRFDLFPGSTRLWWRGVP